MLKDRRNEPSVLMELLMTYSVFWFKNGSIGSDKKSFAICQLQNYTKVMFKYTGIILNVSLTKIISAVSTLVGNLKRKARTE